MMLRVEDLSYGYPSTTGWALRDIVLAVEAGEVAAVLGESGSGKSTLLRALNGLVPHFYGGRFGGRVVVGGRDTRTSTVAELSGIVGYLNQEPESQAILDRVWQEVAFGPWNQGLHRGTVLARVEEALEVLEIGHLRERDVSTLSGGERQRVQIAATLALGASFLALDEPFSQIDPWAAPRLADWMVRLRRERGVGLIIAEHRAGRVLPLASSLVELDSSGRVRLAGDPRSLLGSIEHPPQLVRLAKALGCPELPLTVEEARALSALIQLRLGQSPPPPARPRESAAAVEIDQITFDHRGVRVLGIERLDVPAGAVTAIMGANGSGKSTLLRLLAGLARPAQGSLRVYGEPVESLPSARRARLVGYVPQNPSQIFFRDTVEQEIGFSLTVRGTVRDPAILLAELDLVQLAARYPFDLSGGERQRLAIATALAGNPPLVVLDEPTRGMDYRHRRALVSTLVERSRAGNTTVIATHDVELAAECAARVVLLANGAVTRSGSAAEVLDSDDALRTDVQRLFGAAYPLVDQVVGRVAPHLAGVAASHQQ
jgi:energy-coupling factor transport system ATP-binding protein